MAKFDIDDDVKVTMGVEVSIGEYAPRGTVSITENGTHNVGGYKYADVDVEPEPQPLQSKTATPTESTQSIVPDENYYGLSEVTVNGISSTYVGTGVTRQSASTIVPTESVQQAVASGIYTTGPISVASISSTYVGTGVAKKSAVDLVASGSTITAPAGYYSSAVSKAIEAGSAFTPAKNISNAPMGLGINYSTGVITASFSWSSAITPTITPGYISQGTAGTISVSGLQYQYLSVTNGRTITPSTESQVAISTNNLAFGTIIVSAIPSEYIIPSGTSSITTNGIYDITNYASVSVNVPASGITPTGTYNITSNGIYDVTNYASASVSVAGGGGDFTIDDIAMRTISGDMTGAASGIFSYAFYYCSKITTASFPNASYISGNGFAYCYSLTTISFPEVKSLGNYAFAYCSNLTTVSFPEVLIVDTSAFTNCRSLTTANFPKATSIGTYTFYSCLSLTTVSFPEVKSMGLYAFAYCSLTTASFPEVSRIGNQAFASCYYLTSISFPKLESIGTSAFQYCIRLETASFPKATSIGSGTFRSCWHLLSLYLLGSSLCTNGGTLTFYSTPISNYTASTSGVNGSIFVPASLYDDYISATNWSVYSSRFVSLTDAEIEALSD